MDARKPKRLVPLPLQAMIVAGRAAESPVRMPIFAPEPNARADLTAGTLYAVTGKPGWIYYGQVNPHRLVAFFQRRDRAIADANSVLSSPVMSLVFVAPPSIARALRSGRWKKLGRFAISQAVATARRVVQWPPFTTTVTIWDMEHPLHDTKARDPEIQALEVIAAWDAEQHIPERLTADSGAEPAAWHVGGPIWRARIQREAFARCFPERPAHGLPADWVPVD
ncbi:hypothetical protein [Acidimangrovimonas pyrenivorans]|uniref:Uncharacterized protein n=1 Tax=Acidimangrovimonas pyrenivorans TaxID=2030798 RepID=A0ABV7ACL8_9RHOB